MKKKIIVIFIIIILLGISAWSTWKIYKQKSDRVLEQSSLRLVVIKDDGQSLGSAVIFDSDDDFYYALTNHHVVDDATRIDALDYTQERYTASVLASSEQRDLSIIKIEKIKRLSTLGLANDFSEDESIKVVGYPSSIFDITQGVISEVKDVDDDLPIDVIVHTASVEHGSSGGAVVNEKNQIIGITYAGYFDDGQWQASYAIPLDAIISFLNAINYEVNA